MDTVVQKIVTALMGVHLWRAQQSGGYILVTAILLGFTISTISAFTLASITSNVTFLRQQTYDSLAAEAAQAGIQAALACANAGSTSWASALSPASDCNGSTTGSTKVSYVFQNSSGSIKSTYSVLVPSTAVNSTTTVTSKGTVTINNTLVSSQTMHSLIRNLPTPDLVIATVGVGSSPMDVIATPDGTKVYVANNNSTNISIINTSNNSTGTNIALSAGAKPRGLAVSADGTRLYVADFSANGYIFAINTSTNALAKTLSLGSTRYPIDIAVLPNGSKIYTVNNSGSDVSVINTSTWTITNVATGYQNGDVVITPDGTKAFASVFGNTSAGNKVYVIDTATNAVLARPVVGSSPIDLVMSSDGSKVYVANTTGGTISVIDTSTYAVSTITTYGSAPQKMALSYDGSKLYVVNSNCGCVNVIDTATKTDIKNIAVGSMPYDIVVTPDGAKVYVTNQSSNDVSVIDTVTKAVTKTIAVGTSPRALTLTPDGSRLYVANMGSNTVSVIDTVGSASGMTSYSY